MSGSGKSSTIAAMVHHINRTQHKHVVTVENPIEFLHRDLSCSITQREVGVDTDSLVVGLRAALRQDPDVVVIGDIADAETIDTAVKGAETGHLVIASMPTPDAVATVERVIATLPREEREIGRMRFAESLRAVVSQQLLPEKDEKGRVAAVEVLLATPAVREALRDQSRFGELRKQMADGRKHHGSQTYQQHVAELIEAGLITEETAKAALALISPGAHRQAREAGRGLLSAGMAGPTLQETTARVLALPREAGTAEAAEARELVAAYLKGLGYRVTEQRFRFHPSGLLAFPVFGAGLGGLALLILPLLLFDGPPAWAAFALASIGLGALALLAFGIGVGWMPIGGETREDANLLAVRAEQPIRRWLVAHLDTKAQAQSMAGRLVSIWVVIAAIAMLLGLALFRLDGTLSSRRGGTGHAPGGDRRRARGARAVSAAARRERGTTAAGWWLPWPPLSGSRIRRLVS